jgi:hypothetical protein
VVTTAVAIMAFQVLAIIGAGMASAVTGCTFDPSNGRITITIDPGEEAAVVVDDVDDLDPESPSGAILFTGTDDVFEDWDQGAGVTTQCGSATNSNTTQIVVLGSPGADEFFYIDNGGWNGGGAFSSTIVWAIDMGSQSAGGFDEVDIYGSDFNVTADEVVLTDAGFTMNGGAGTWLGNEYSLVRGFDGNDVLDASGAVNLIADLHGGPDDDFVAPGPQAVNPFTLFGEDIRGGSGFDTLSYGTRTTATSVDAANGWAGRDANGDCDPTDVGDEQDSIVDFEAYETGSGNDCLEGDLGVDEVFIPGDGDDDIFGNAGDDDALDYTSSSAGMVIDPATGMATGQGTDEFTNIVNFVGSPFDDTLLWDGTTDGFVGGDGVDTVDANAAVTPQIINLDLLDDFGGVTVDTVENAIGGSSNDTLTGNDLRNVLTGNAGDDFLFGAAGNDILDGGAGNDAFDGGAGADKVSFASNTTAGVTVDMNLGFATSSDSGDDSFGGAPLAITGPVEIIQGSPFNDSITGGGGLTTLNFLFAGGNGKDTLTGSGSNDTLKGGAGNDRLRGLEGGDTLKGGKGSNDKGWGGPGVDFCTGVEVEKGCE